MITSNVIHRVFRIRHGGSEATGFTLDVDDRQYIVTARHAVATLQDSGALDIFAHGVWNSSPVRLVGHAPGERDISVLAVDHQLTPGRLTMEPTSKGVIYGQDVFFLGFPYGLLGKFLLTEHGHPLPLVKKATVSLFQTDEVFLLDGHNNPGFSGGPVVFTTPGVNEYKVFAVISGYKSVDQSVVAGGKQVYAGAGQPMVVPYNTGIIVAWAIDFAVQLARGNPIGVPCVAA
jgi:S1-C subfamily serine protease